MNDKQQPQKDENSEGGGTVPSYTDRILWSDCPEELYLKRILEEQEGHKFDGSGGKDSLMGDSTVENLLVSNRADGSVRSWQDWAPIARSIATKSAGNKSNNNGVGDEPAKPSPADTNLGIQPRFVNFEDDSSSTTTLPDRLFPESVNFDEEIAQIEQTGMSTITGDHGFVGIQPQIDYSSWWIYPGDGTYAKLQDECQPTSVAQATSGASSGTRIPHKNRDEQPLTPSTYNSNTTSDDREVDRKRCSFLGRAPRHTLFRRLIIAIVFFFLVFLLLSGIAMIRSKTVGTEQGSLGATSSIPTPATFTPFPNDSPAAPGSAPFNSPSDEITKPTGTPSFLVIPGPYKTQSPTKLPASYPTNMPHQDVVTKVPIMPQTNTPMPSGLTTTLDFATLVQFILDQSPGSSETLFDESSAQFKALQWVFSDVSRRPLPDYRILQRWVLGVLFYALGGDSWSRDDDWLTSTNECFWFTTSNDEICDERGRITIIELRDNSLEGTLPGELSLLSDSLGKNVSGFRSMI